MKFFYNKSSLELQLEVCRIWAYEAPGAQVDKGQWELWEQICVGHILDPRCALAWSFSLDVPFSGLKKTYAFGS